MTGSLLLITPLHFTIVVAAPRTMFAIAGAASMTLPSASNPIFAPLFIVFSSLWPVETARVYTDAQTAGEFTHWSYDFLGIRRYAGIWSRLRHMEGRKSSQNHFCVRRTQGVAIALINPRCISLEPS